MNAFWICLRFVRYRFVKCRFARSKIYTFRFVCFRDVLKTSSRHVFKTSLRRLQRNNFSSSKTSSRRFARSLQDVFKTSWSSRRLGRQKIVTLKTCWRSLQYMSPTNVCWEVSLSQLVTLLKDLSQNHFFFCYI